VVPPRAAPPALSPLVPPPPNDPPKDAATPPPEPPEPADESAVPPVPPAPANPPDPDNELPPDPAWGEPRPESHPNAATSSVPRKPPRAGRFMASYSPLLTVASATDGGSLPTGSVESVGVAANQAQQLLVPGFVRK
jgi:hypothetical protein